jgi:hypothetical protein
MSSVYVVIENGDPYEVAYTSFNMAKETVKRKYNDMIQEEIKEANGESICSEIDVLENISGVTYLYIEKGIHIYIYKLPIL